MGEVNRMGLEAELGRYYAGQQRKANPDTLDALVLSMTAEDVRMRRTQPRSMGTAAFIVAQARFIPVWTWVAQIAIVALMCVVAWLAPKPDAAKLSIGLLSAATVLVGVPTVSSSKANRVVELEYSCMNNAASVLVARLVVLGCSSSLVVAIMVAVTATSLDVTAFDVALWVCPPFFLSCAGSLMALRKATPAMATTLCVAWTAICSTALLTLSGLLPDLYAQTSIATWAAAAACALVWLVREVVMTMRAVAGGLDVFSSQLARTYN